MKPSFSIWTALVLTVFWSSTLTIMNVIQKSEAIKAGLRKGFQDGSSKMVRRKCYGYDVGPDGELDNPLKSPTRRSFNLEAKIMYLQFLSIWVSLNRSDLICSSLIQKSEAIKAGLRKGFQDGSPQMLWIWCWPWWWLWGSLKSDAVCLFLYQYSVLCKYDTLTIVARWKLHPKDHRP